MLSFSDAASIAASPSVPADPRLRQLLATAVRHWTDSDLLDRTHLLVVEAGDAEQAIVAETGFSPLVSPFDGTRFGATGFQPFWDHLQDHGGWFELTVTVGNSGFAFVIFIHAAGGVDPELLALCCTYTA